MNSFSFSALGLGARLGFASLAVVIIWLAIYWGAR